MDLNLNIDWQEVGQWMIDHSPTFELRIIILLCMGAFLAILSGVILILKRKNKAKVTLDGHTLKQKRLGTFIKVFTIIDIVTLVFFVIFTALTLLIRPFVTDVYPQTGEKLDSGAPEFKVTFDMPVSDEKLVFNMSPEIAGRWKPKYIWGTNFAREFTFEPAESIYPGNPVVIYVTGIRTPWSMGHKHEHAIEYDAIEIPSVVEITPATGTEKVPTNVTVKATLDGFTGDFLAWNVVSNPDIGTFKINSQGKDLFVTFDKPLLQDSTYEITLQRAPRSFNVKTGAEMQKGEFEEVGKVSFKTVTTPLLSSFAPKGEGNATNANIEIVFDQPMDRADVEKHFEITPAVEGSFTWTDDRTLTFKPSKPYAKNTEYKVFIKAGTKSADGGVTPQDISAGFWTIGVVRVVGISPSNGANTVDPNAAILVTFNQAVDKASAQSKFSISPAVAGTFSWSGNRMSFKPNARLSYSTKYYYSVAGGVKTISGLDSTSDYNYNFTTKQNIVSLNLPWYKQAEGFTCNIAATRMALAYRGIYKTESNIKSGIGYSDNPNSGWVDGYGVHAGPVSSYISGYRGTSYRTGMSITDLTAAIDAGNPVIGWVYNRYTTPSGAFTLPSGATGYHGMHSEVVRGYIGDPSSPTHILVNDPWRGQLTYTVGGWTGIWSYLGYTGVEVK